MNPLQRRVLALCIFALAFIFFYEARGTRLIMLGALLVVIMNVRPSGIFGTSRVEIA